MNIINSATLAVVRAVGMKKIGLYTALATITVMIDSVAQADTIEPLTQYCSEGDVFTSANKICGINLETTVNASPCC